MIGWSVLLAVLTLLFLFLFWRRRERLQTRLSELSSRVAQVEELLLEICSVIEEKESFPELISPAEIEDFLAEGEADAISPRSVPHNEINLATGGQKADREIEPETEIREGTREKSGETKSEQTSGKVSRERIPDQVVTVELENNESHQKANSEAAQPKMVSSSRGREINKERLDQIDPSTLPERSKMIVELLQKGLSVKEIARTTGMGQGEVQLIIDLYLQ